MWVNWLRWQLIIAFTSAIYFDFASQTAKQHAFSAINTPFELRPQFAAALSFIIAVNNVIRGEKIALNLFRMIREMSWPICSDI